MSPSAVRYGVHTMRIAGAVGSGTECSSCATNVARVASAATSGSVYATGFGTTWCACFARVIADASLVRKSITANAPSLSFARADIARASALANGAAYLPVALTIGSVATFHGTPGRMSAANQGPDIAIAARPSLNSEVTSGACASSGTVPD